jgi:hypothetical protein
MCNFGELFKRWLKLPCEIMGCSYRGKPAIAHWAQMAGFCVAHLVTGVWSLTWSSASHPSSHSSEALQRSRSFQLSHPQTKQLSAITPQLPCPGGPSRASLEQLEHHRAMLQGQAMGRAAPGSRASVWFWSERMDPHLDSWFWCVSSTDCTVRCCSST